jgi:NADH-quinone oxidoreductase subunit M
VILAAVMLKMGGYGLLRFNLPLFPDASVTWAPWIIALSVIGILYGAFVALVQPDMKKLIAYSSVSHMGFVTLGIFVFNLQGMDGAMMVMMAHGFNTGALFLLVGVIYERGHTRLISAFSGLATRMPVYSAFFALFMFASIGLPGLSGFIGEFLVAVGVWLYNPWVAVPTFAVVIFAAWYMMWMFQRIIFGRAPGELPDPHDGELTAQERIELHEAGDGHGHAAPLPVSGGAHDHVASSDQVARGNQTGSSDKLAGANEIWPDLTLKEALTLVPLAVLTIVFGVFPGPLLEIVEPAFERILAPFI